MRRRERWTEQEVLELPQGEQDYFERKGGRLFEDNKNKIADTVSIALSALANAEGGYLVLGVADDGTLDGVPGQVGSTSTRDWLEQQIPNLVDPPIREFRIHSVEKSVDSKIPSGREIIVIDVEDSLEVHQARDGRYYYRAGGRSQIARHSYLEQRRQRVRPVLDFELREVRPINAYACKGGAFLETEFVFLVKNVGQMVANKWGLQITGARGAAGRQDDYFFYRNSYPIKKGKAGGIRLDDTILPGRHLEEIVDVGFLLHPGLPVQEQIKTLIQALKVTCHVALEIGPGVTKTFDVSPVSDPQMLSTYVVMKLGRDLV